MCRKGDGCWLTCNREGKVLCEEFPGIAGFF